MGGLIMLNPKTKRTNLLKHSKLIIYSSSLTLLLSGCSIFPKEEPVSAPPLIRSSDVNLKTAKATVASISNVLNITGFFIPSDSTQCYFTERGGYLKKLNVVQGDSVKQGDVLAELDTDSIKLQLQQEEIKLKKLQLRYDSVQNNAQSTQLDKENVALDMELQALQVENLKNELSKMTLRAPYSGIITFKNNVVLGQRINAYDPVFIISKSDNLLVEYGGGELQKLKIGMDVRVALSGDEVNGKIVSLGTIDAKTNYGADKTVPVARIKLDKLPKGAKFGLQAQIFVDLFKKDNVVTIPKTALRYFDKTPYVKVMDNGTKIEKFVTVGVENNDVVEIVDGLKAGEEVITN